MFLSRVSLSFIFQALFIPGLATQYFSRPSLQGKSSQGQGPVFPLFSDILTSTVFRQLYFVNQYSDIGISHSVNKPLQAAGMSADYARSRQIDRKMNIWPRIEASRANIKF